jgi:hypothetical protein
MKRQGARRSGFIRLDIVIEAMESAGKAGEACQSIPQLQPVP